MAYVAGASYFANKGLPEGQACLLDTLRGIIKRYGKRYCFVSHETLLEKLREYHGIQICRRTLCYWLKTLEAKRLIYRQKRNTWDAWRATAYYLLDRGGWGVVKAKKLIGVMKRLAQVLPSRAQKIAHDKNTTHILHSGEGLKNRPIASKKMKRRDTSELRKQDVSAPMPDIRPKEGEERPAFVRECIDNIKGLFKSKDALSEESLREPLERFRALNESKGLLKAQIEDEEGSGNG